MSLCTLCPRLCRTDREKGEVGYCGQTAEIRICRAAPHFFEEPPISGERGSGTVFFAGCSLRCEYCQNKAISRGAELGRAVSPAELADVFLELEQSGVHNINLVTPTHFANGVREALELCRHKLRIPVVYNTSGYERVETLRGFEGLVDVYLPDFKYATKEIAAKYSHAPDYPEVASEALVEMFRQTGKYRYGGDGMLVGGVVVRHLVLPAGRKESILTLDTLARLLPIKGILLSLMSQYTPEFALDSKFSELHRRLTSFEYNSVLSHALELGFEGFMQSRASASGSYTPDFTQEK
ncbi:MAG: radical SAM protein [Ruminococcaceae bacterium]|nr:radical SAM protein [Oscillospiraceae bacterium]